MTDDEVIAHLRYSSDHDDQSIVKRVDIIRWLKSRSGSLTPEEERWVQILEIVNEKELHFLRSDNAYRVNNPRPAWPRWHWPDELEELFCRSLQG